MRRFTFLFMGLMAMASGIFTETSFALTTDFHGYLESRYVIRDTSGFQHGFMDDTESVQWIQETQFDLEVRPEYSVVPQFHFEKVFLRFRGAYDAIFDVSDDFGNIREKSPADFELGKDDLRYEADLREAFLDFVGQNSAGTIRANLRLGRQIVQWGEADGFNLMNVVNPNDNRNKMFFFQSGGFANATMDGTYGRHHPRNRSIC